MPRATVNINDTERIELKTCPEGFVVLRRLTYGQMLHRRDLMMQMRIEGSRKRQQDMEATMNMAFRKIAEFEFNATVVEHNLEDDNGNLLDFKQSNIVDILDPRIGEEIQANIDRMNQFEGELPNSSTGSNAQ